VIDQDMKEEVLWEGLEDKVCEIKKLKHMLMWRALEQVAVT